MSTIIQLAIVLGIMVLVHEFGHFAVAKLCGIRVEVFSIGFGKRLFGFRRGDTDYRLSVLPLGGYVKMAGDNPGEAPTGDPGEFNAHPRWQRILVALAGPFANFILALALMAGVSMLHNEVQEYISGPAQTDYIAANTEAAKTGIRSGDLIIHYDTIENPTWEQVAIRSLLNINQTVPFSYIHDGQRTDTKIFVESKGGADDLLPRQTRPHRPGTDNSGSGGVTGAQHAGDPCRSPAERPYRLYRRPPAPLRSRAARLPAGSGRQTSGS